MKANLLRLLMPCLLLVLSALSVQSETKTITSTFTSYSSETGLLKDGFGKNGNNWMVSPTNAIYEAGDRLWGVSSKVGAVTMTSEYTVTGSIQSMKMDASCAGYRITVKAGDEILCITEVGFDNYSWQVVPLSGKTKEISGQHITLLFEEAGDENVPLLEFNRIVLTYEATKAPANLSFSANTATAKVGESFTPPTLNNPHNLEVTWTSSDPSVATVNSTGAVSPLNEGTTNIIASFAGNDSYLAGEAWYTLRVKPDADLINGINYKLDDTTLTAEVKANSPEYTGNIIIPATVTDNGKTFTVTSIGQEAFFNCSNLLSVSLPNTLTSIGRLAFYGCRNLLSISLPNTVTSIGQQAFSYCDAMKSFTIPKSVTTIEAMPFGYSTGMETIVVEKGNPVYSSPANSNAIIVTAENKLVAGCKGTVIPEGVKIIDYGAFTGVTGLKTIKLPRSLTKLVSQAFYKCDLTSIVIPQSVTTIETGAIHSCAALTSIKVEDGNTVYASPNGSNAVIEKATNNLVAGCKTTIIPNYVKVILSYAFAGQSGSTSLTIPDGVEEIGFAAFEGCNFETIQLPNSVKKMDYGVLRDCVSLKNVYIGNGIQKINDYIFNGCFQLTDFYLAAPTVPQTNNDSFSGLSPTHAVTLHVPAESVGVYKKDDNWSAFTIVALKDGEFPEQVEEAVLDSAEVEGSYKLWVNGIRVTQQNRLDVLGDGNGKDNPSVMFDGLHTLVLSNAELDSIVSQLPNELVIFVQGDNTVGTKSTPGIHHTGREPIPLTITTSGNYPGTLTITSNVKLTEGFSQTTAEHLVLLSDESRKAVYGPLIHPFTNDAVITFNAKDYLTADGDEIDLSNRVVNNILYTLRSENEDGFYEDESAMVLNTVMPLNPSFGDGVVGSASYAENFAGMTIMIPAGEGDITIDNLSTDGYVMAVKIGSGLPYTFQNTSWTKNTIHYKVSVPSYVYIYNAGLSGSASDRLRGGKKTTTRIVVHSIVIKPQNISSSNEVQDIIPSSQTIDMNPVIVDTHISDLYVNRKGVDSWYDMNGQQIDKPSQLGIYIFNGRKVIVR